MAVEAAVQRQYSSASGDWERFWKAQDPLHQIVKAAPDLQIILAVRLSTSWVALSGVANLDADEEMS